MVIYPLGILFHRLDQILLLLFNISLYRCHFNLIRKRNRFIGFSLPIYNGAPNEGIIFEGCHNSWELQVIRML